MSGIDQEKRARCGFLPTWRGSRKRHNLSAAYYKIDVLRHTARVISVDTVHASVHKNLKCVLSVVYDLHEGRLHRCISVDICAIEDNTVRVSQTFCDRRLSSNCIDPIIDEYRADSTEVVYEVIVVRSFFHTTT